MKRLLICVVAASLLIASCDTLGAKAELTPEEKLAGNYAGSLEIPQEMIDMVLSFAKAGGADPEKLEEMEAEIRGTDFSLDLRADGACTMTTVSKGESDTADGTWTLNEEGTEVTLQIAKVSEAAANMGLAEAGQDLVLVVSEDGMTLSHEETQMEMTVRLTFTRQ